MIRPPTVLIWREVAHTVHLLTQSSTCLHLKGEETESCTSRRHRVPQFCGTGMTLELELPARKRSHTGSPFKAYIFAYMLLKFV
jgi:hypothetical protein